MTQSSGDDYRDQVAGIFAREFARLRRFLQRESGDGALAEDIAQDSFVKLYERGRLPDVPLAWLWTVSLNSLRNARTMAARRTHLLTASRAERAHGDTLAAPDAALQRAEQGAAVRAALAGLPERERRMLLLRAEGYHYREIAQILDLNENSVGTLLARARRAFLDAYDERRDDHAP